MTDEQPPAVLPDEVVRGEVTPEVVLPEDVPPAEAEGVHELEIEPEPEPAEAVVEPEPVAEPEPAAAAVEPVAEGEVSLEVVLPEVVPPAETEGVPELEIEPEPEPAAAAVEPVAEAEPDAVEAAGDLPPLADDAALASALEALLLVVDSPAADESLADALDQPVARVREALRRMTAELAERGSGIDLRHAGEGWRFVTRDRYAPFVEKLLLDGQRAKLTRAALETLAVIAYRQPVTRARVAAVRGVNVDGVIRTLVGRGLIAETGTDSDTGGILYRTTELFLERLGLSSLEDLPPIAPLLPEVDAIDDV